VSRASDPGEAAIGLCAVCRHARRIDSARGSRFWLCSRSTDDPRFAKYPRLPVLRCPGFESIDEPPPRRVSSNA
jgi:hypothetical protein